MFHSKTYSSLCSIKFLQADDVVDQTLPGLLPELRYDSPDIVESDYLIGLGEEIAHPALTVHLLVQCFDHFLDLSVYLRLSFFSCGCIDEGQQVQLICYFSCPLLGLVGQVALLDEVVVLAAGLRYMWGLVVHWLYYFGDAALASQQPQDP